MWGEHLWTAGEGGTLHPYADNLADRRGKESGLRDREGNGGTGDRGSGRNEGGFIYPTRIN